MHHSRLICTNLYTLISFSWLMQTLFALSIVCLLVLIGAGIALARHLRANRQPSTTLSLLQRDDFAQHLFEAAKVENSPEPRKLPYQTLQDIAAKKSWNQPPGTVTLLPSHELRPDFPRLAAEPLPLNRKPPQISRRVGSERLDWAYFNKNRGGLTDSYQTPGIRANSRNSLKRH
jgi:hypothetical protein